MEGIIYKIENKINGKVYIGQTVQSLSSRWYRHCQLKGLSESESNMHIKRAILKYGKENFSISILEKCDSSVLNEKEIYYINKYDSFKNGYNKTIGGSGKCGVLSIPFDKQIEIIDLYESGLSLRSISQLYNTSHTVIKNVLKNHSIQLRDTRTYKLSQYQRQEIINDINNGLSRKDIMNKWNISKSYLSQLINNKRRI